MVVRQYARARGGVYEARRREPIEHEQLANEMTLISCRTSSTLHRILGFVWLDSPYSWLESEERDEEVSE